MYMSNYNGKLRHIKTGKVQKRHSLEVLQLRREELESITVLPIFTATLSQMLLGGTWEGFINVLEPQVTIWEQ